MDKKKIFEKSIEMVFLLAGLITVGFVLVITNVIKLRNDDWAEMVAMVVRPSISPTNRPYKYYLAPSFAIKNGQDSIKTSFLSVTKTYH